MPGRKCVCAFDANSKMCRRAHPQSHVCLYRLAFTPNNTSRRCLYPKVGGITNRNKSLLCVRVVSTHTVLLFSLAFALVLLLRSFYLRRALNFFFSSSFLLMRFQQRWWDNFLLFIKKSKLCFIVMRIFFCSQTDFSSPTRKDIIRDFPICVMANKTANSKQQVQ